WLSACSVRRAGSAAHSNFALTCRFIFVDGLDLTAVHNKFRQRPVGVDIFCRVIDNFGDAGVCWRLARRLAHHHGWRVRLWIDDVDTLRRLHPFPATSANTFRLDEIDVVRWNDTTENLHPRDV